MEALHVIQSYLVLYRCSWHELPCYLDTPSSYCTCNITLVYSIFTPSFEPRGKDVYGLSTVSPSVKSIQVIKVPKRKGHMSQKIEWSGMWSLLLLKIPIEWRCQVVPGVLCLYALLCLSIWVALFLFGFFLELLRYQVLLQRKSRSCIFSVSDTVLDRWY